MFPPSLVGYYRGNFKAFNTKLIETEDAFNVFFLKFPFITPEALPKINFEARQIVVVSGSGPELIGLFSVEETGVQRCNIIVKRILQNEYVKGSASMLVFLFSKNYKLNVLFKPPVQLVELEPLVLGIERKLNAVIEVLNFLSPLEIESGEMVEKINYDINFYEKQKAYNLWKTVTRYCGKSLEEYDSFQQFRFTGH